MRRSGAVFQLWNANRIEEVTNDLDGSLPRDHRFLDREIFDHVAIASGADGPRFDHVDDLVTRVVADRKASRPELARETRVEQPTSWRSESEVGLCTTGRNAPGEHGRHLIDTTHLLGERAGRGWVDIDSIDDHYDLGCGVAVEVQIEVLAIGGANGDRHSQSVVDDPTDRVASVDPDRVAGARPEWAVVAEIVHVRVRTTDAVSGQ